MSELETPQPTGVSRRTVTTAMAWAVPAVAIATAVPAYAGASRDFVSFTGQACKDPGGGTNKFYYFQVEITNSTGSQLDVVFTGVEVNENPGNAATITPGNVSVAPHQMCTVTLRFGTFPNSANGEAILSYTANTVQQPDIDSGLINDLPPLTDSGGGSCPISYPSSVCVAI